MHGARAMVCVLPRCSRRDVMCRTGLGWPFDSRFLWNVLTVLVCTALYEAWILPASINFKKVEEKAPDTAEEEEGSKETRV